MKRFAAAAALAIIVCGPALAEPLAVKLSNKSHPTLCAEDDNVQIDVRGAAKRFTLEARQPAAIGTIVVDSTAPDFTDCITKDEPPQPGSERLRVVLHEDDQSILVGYRVTGFWRRAEVPLKVRETVTHQLQLVQLFVKTPKGPYEYLVLYPLDGYWRARPLPPARLEQVAYGTSFLVGPIEQTERPFVPLKEIAYDPQLRRFTLQFEKGGNATLTVATPTEQAAKIDVTFASAVQGKPFLTFRSMYVTESNADSARVEWKSPGAKGWREAPVMQFKGSEATTFRLGRVVPSRHNTSAPDMFAGPFTK
jgi:hypothetical protein